MRSAGWILSVLVLCVVGCGPDAEVETYGDHNNPHNNRDLDLNVNPHANVPQFRNPGVGNGQSPNAGEGREVIFGSLKSTTPSDWVRKPPTSSTRHAHFELPAATGDKTKGSLVVYRGIGGGAAGNVDRWKKQFDPPNGKVSTLKLGGKTATRLDAKGTYKGSFGIPGGKDYQMVAVYWEGPDTVYQFYLTGPEKTVQKHLDGFDRWLKSFQ